MWIRKALLICGSGLAGAGIGLLLGAVVGGVLSIDQAPGHESESAGSGMAALFFILTTAMLGSLAGLVVGVVTGVRRLLQASRQSHASQ